MIIVMGGIMFAIASIRIHKAVVSQFEFSLINRSAAAYCGGGHGGAI
jgi:hypothetical protein